jgi:hypothetical protein
MVKIFKTCFIELNPFVFNSCLVISGVGNDCSFQNLYIQSLIYFMAYLSKVFMVE